MKTIASDRFGAFGGRYVPETLIPALDELEAAFDAAMADKGFRAELDAMLKDYVGRPSPLSAAPRLSAHVGAQVFLKREDLNHTGAHKINNTVGQALLARRMGKASHHRRDGRRSARRRHRHRLRALRIELHRLHGRGGHAAAGAERLPDEATRRGGDSGHLRNADAEGRDERSHPRLGHQRQRQLLHHRLRRRARPRIREWFAISNR